MAEKTLKKIIEEMDYHVKAGNIGKVMDLVDEHGTTVDRMYYAIIDGDLDKVLYLESLGIDPTHERFIKTAIRSHEYEILQYQISLGVEIDRIITFAQQMQVLKVTLWATIYKAEITDKK